MLITSKGQVTIPVSLREELGFMPGTEIEFVREDDRISIRKAPNSRGRGRDAVERMTGALDIGMTTDELMALLRGDE